MKTFTADYEGVMAEKVECLQIAYDRAKATILRADNDHAGSLYRQVGGGRTYRGATGYGPDHYAVNGTTAICSIANRVMQQGHSRNLRPVDAVMLVTVSLLSKHKLPTWFLTQEMFDALDQTEPPEGLRWSDVKFPFLAGMFLFPFGAVRQGELQYGYVTYAKAEKGAVFVVPGTEVASKSDMDALMFTASSPMDNQTTIMSYDAEAWPSARVPDGKEEFDTFRDGGFNVKRTDADRREDLSMMARLANVSMNAILLMNARPEMVEDAVLVEASRKLKKGGKTPEVWSPRWLGRTYRTVRPAGDGTHASPRLHWRRGHFRFQRYGIGRKEMKTIWIEPMLVNAKTDE